MIDVLAPFVRLMGVRNGAQAGATLVVLVCWAVAVWAAWRAAGRIAAVAAWATSVVMLEVASVGAPWEANNISITMLGMFAAVLASWAAATGTWRAWWWAVALGSLCAQGYIPHGMIVIGPVVWAGLAIAGARRAGEGARATRAQNALVVGWLIGTVAWAQTALDVVLHDGGNLRDLLGEVANPRPPVGAGGFFRSIAWIFSVPPRWGEITKSFAQAGTATDFIRGPFITGTLVVVVLTAASWRYRRTTTADQRQLRIILLLVVLGAAVNTTQLPQDYLRSFQLGWLVVASIFAWFVVGLSVVAVLQHRFASELPPRWIPRLRVAALGIGGLALLAAGLARPDQISDMKGRQFTIDAMVEPAVDQTMASLEASGALERDSPFLVLALDSRLNEVSMDTILSNLIVRGVDARTEARGAHYGDRRIVDAWGGSMLLVTTDLGPVQPVGTKLASATMPGWSRAEFDELAERVARVARDASTVQMEPWALDELPRYLAGWFGADSCRVASELRAGDRSVADLPPGLLLTLYGDLAVRSPRLSRAMQDDASAMLGQAPIEVWSASRPEVAPTLGVDILRDGSLCPPAATE